MMPDSFGFCRPVRRLCAIVLLSLAASCSTWRHVPGVGLAPMERERIGSARVFLRDGTVLELEDAAMTADSIVGLAGVDTTRLAVARRDVVEVDGKRAEPATTLLGGVLAGAAGVYVALLALFGS